MTILDKVKKFYETNSKELASFLETITLFETNSNYPNSVVIKFGKDQIVGEISVWNLENETYMECEYANLKNLDNEPVVFVKTINAETVIGILTNEFKELQKISKSNDNR